MVNRRDVLKVALGGGTYAALGPHFGRTEEKNPEGRPNFVFICADDLGWGDLGVYGHPEMQKPHLGTTHTPRPQARPSRRQMNGSITEADKIGLYARTTHCECPQHMLSPYVGTSHASS